MILKEFLPYLLGLFVLIPLNIAFCLRIIKKNNKKIDQLESLTNDLLESKEEKERLIRVLIHDISNPLAVIKYYLDALQNEARCDSRANEFIQKSFKNLNTVNNIVSYVREYECLKSSHKKTPAEEISLHECLAEVQQIFTECYKKKNVALEIVNELPDNAKVRFGKVSFVHSVLANLVSNALKFSNPGSSVLIKTFEDQSEQIVIEIIDKGIGIPKEHVETLFDLDKCISKIGTSGEQGSGLGLPLVKAHTTMFGGKIKAISSQDENKSGTTISIFLPKAI